uniref:Centromere protein N n=1 Tax=Homalodisca liturata TaxID=320908 RepID=A0A1B6J4U3_9HEMI
MATPQNSTPTQPDNRKLQKQRLKNEIKTTLSRFHINQLTSESIVSLFELETVEINHHLNELKLPFKKQSVVQLLGVRARAFSVEELSDLHGLLQLYRIAYFSHTKNWSPLNLLEPDDNLQSPADEEIIRRNLLQAFRIKGLNAIINVITHDELVWVMIVGKKLTRKKGIRLQTPLFLCYEVGTPYIFVASPVPISVMECILKAMQYKKHKVHHLEGRNIKSLLFLLRNKAMNVGKNKTIAYEPAEAEVGRRNIDFTKRKAREIYANNVFQATDSVMLESLSLTADSTWRDNVIVPEMTGEPFKATLQLKSKNLFGMIKDMIANNMIVTPLPEYVQTVLHSGKNRITMRQPK